MSLLDVAVAAEHPANFKADEGATPISGSHARKVFEGWRPTFWSAESRVKGWQQRGLESAETFQIAKSRQSASADQKVSIRARESNACYAFAWPIVQQNTIRTYLLKALRLRQVTGLVATSHSLATARLNTSQFELICAGDSPITMRRVGVLESLLDLLAYLLASVCVEVLLGSWEQRHDGFDDKLASCSSNFAQQPA